MSKYYNPQRTRNLYNPSSSEPFRLSRSKIDLYLECPRCFYLDRRMGIGRPPGYPFSLNSAVDALLKKEFDIHRAKGTAHPLMEQYGINAIPLAHDCMDEWRDSLRRGVTYQVPGTNLIVTGGVDDVWVSPSGELIVVDYKATAKEGEVTLDAEWQDGYKRQMEVYQWLFRKNGFKVSTTGYFVYCNGDSSRDGFNGQLHFDIKIIPYEGNDAWVEPTLVDIRKCLVSDSVPSSGEDCDFCSYRNAANVLERSKPKIEPSAVKDKVKIKNFMDDEEEDYRPKTVKQAVERFIELSDTKDFDLINECSKSEMDFLCANLEGEVMARCELDRSNVDLLEDCGSRDMEPKEASRVIVRALWHDFHPNG